MNTDYMVEAELTRLAIEKSPDAIIIVDSKGIIQLVNCEAELLTGQSRKALKGQVIENLVPDSVKEKHREFRQHYLTNPTRRNMGPGIDLTIKQGNKLVPVDINLSPASSELLNMTVTIVTIRSRV